MLTVSELARSLCLALTQRSSVPAQGPLAQVSWAQQILGEVERGLLELGLLVVCCLLLLLSSAAHPDQVFAAQAKSAALCFRLQQAK
jgi:hypothetical protein